MSQRQPFALQTEDDEYDPVTSGNDGHFTAGTEPQRILFFIQHDPDGIVVYTLSFPRQLIDICYFSGEKSVIQIYILIKE